MAGPMPSSESILVHQSLSAACKTTDINQSIKTTLDRFMIAMGAKTKVKYVYIVKQTLLKNRTTIWIQLLTRR